MFGGKMNGAVSAAATPAKQRKQTGRQAVRHARRATGGEDILGCFIMSSRQAAFYQLADVLVRGRRMGKLYYLGSRVFLREAHVFCRIGGCMEYEGYN
jgi:hypothetical protein